MVVNSVDLFDGNRHYPRVYLCYRDFGLFSRLFGENCDWNLLSGTAMSSHFTSFDHCGQISTNLQPKTWTFGR